MKRMIMLAALLVPACYLTQAQEKAKHEDTEFYTPVPPVVTPGASLGDAPSDAVILFDGKSLDQWVNAKDSSAASWILADNVMTVNKATGDIQT